MIVVMVGDCLWIVETRLIASLRCVPCNFDDFCDGLCIVETDNYPSLRSVPCNFDDFL